MFKKYISTLKLVRFVDGDLSPDQADSLRHIISQSPKLQRTVTAMEEIKILAHEAPRINPSDEFCQRALSTILQDPIGVRPWFAPVLTAIESLATQIATMPRIALSATLAGSLVLAATVSVVAVEHQRELRISQIEGAPVQIIDGTANRLKLQRRIVLNEPIKTGVNEMLTLQRPDLFTLHLDPQTQLKFKQLSHAGGFGQNQIDLQQGAVMFKTEKHLKMEGIRVQTPWFTATNHGTIALIEQTSDGFIAAVLQGKLALTPSARLSSLNQKQLMVQNNQEFSFIAGQPLGKPQTIRQQFIDKLIAFAPSDKLVVLGLPDRNPASALVDTKKINVAFAYVDIPDRKRRALFDRVSELFDQTEQPSSLEEARQILEQLSVMYEQDGRLDICSSLLLLSASISASLGNDPTALAMLNRVAENSKYTDETRALAVCAIGIIHERQEKIDQAKKSFSLVIEKWGHTKAATEARACLASLEMPAKK